MVYLRGYRQNSIQIIRLLVGPERNPTHVNRPDGFNKSRTNQRRRLISVHSLGHTVKTTAGSSCLPSPRPVVPL